MPEEELKFHKHTGEDSPQVKQTDVLDVYGDSEVVHLTGNETIADIKTFTSIPVLPASDPTTDNQAVRKAYVDLILPATETISSTTARDNANINRESTSATYEKLKEIEFNEVDGTINVRYQGVRGTGNACYLRLYKNGVAIGDEEDPGITTSTYDEDVAVETGDLLQMYLKSSDGVNNIFVETFQLRYDKIFTITPGTINTN